uniref:Uncharacterized protein n=1 Tax=Spongospora subterranea TaxID=70186 RepID=A0A0H5RDY8_9EUKA|eukprot:CRZ12223.1 hypothetical protein [Spongospora subterranea]
MRPITYGKRRNQVDSGRCYCHRCGLNCSFFDFTRHLDDAAEVTSANNLFLKPSLTTALPQVDQTKAAISRSNLRSHPDVLEYLTKSRGLSLEVLEKYGVGVDEAHFANETTGLWNKEKCITFPWARMV